MATDVEAEVEGVAIRACARLRTRPPLVYASGGLFWQYRKRYYEESSGGKACQRCSNFSCCARERFAERV